MSFWLNKPVFVNQDFTSDYIVSAENLVKNTTNEITNSKVQLEYDIILNPDDNQKLKLVDFINNNYSTNDSDLVLKYSKRLLDYFITNDSLCVIFYPMGTKESFNNEELFDKMIGLVMGRKQCIYIKELPDKYNNQTNFFKSYNCIDVDFLCLIKQLRNMHVSSYMINILTNQCVIRYNMQIYSAIYTVSKRLCVNSFCKKTYYHRPLKIHNLLQSEMIHNNSNLTLLQKLYNTFSYPIKLLENVVLQYINTLNLNENGLNILANALHDKLLTYNQNNYNIYEYKSQHDILKMLTNDIFHKFIVIDKNTNEILDFMCLYHLDTRNLKYNVISRNGYLYSMFFKKYETMYISYIFELVSEYCYKNNIFDMIITMNIYDIKPDQYKFFKLLKGSADLYYYMYNINTPNILPWKNGLVTI